MLKTIIFISSLCVSSLAFAKNDISLVYGSYNAGCIENSVALPLNSKNYQVQIRDKGRNYAHPQMLDYLYNLMKKAKDAKLPNLLIGDISKKYGGPFNRHSNHASHNTGLDVDIPFDFSTPRKSLSELKKPKDKYIVTSKSITKHFTKNIEKLIYLAANDDRVERIFVAPMIKKRMCDLYSHDSDNDIWLSRLRPWFGHKAHMHIRLACPLDSKDCIAQNKVPNGNGCGYELESWFLPPTTTTSVKPKKEEKVYPKQCTLLFKKYKGVK